MSAERSTEEKPPTSEQACHDHGERDAATLPGQRARLGRGVAAGRHRLGGCWLGGRGTAWTGRAFRFGSQALSEFHDRRIECDAQLLAQQALVHPRGLERPGPVASGRESLHQAERYAGVEGIERSEPAPPRGRVAVLAGRRRRREPLQRRGSAIPQPSPRRLHPPFELRRIAQIEAVQERPRVELRGRRVGATLERVLEGLHVAHDDDRIERELGRA